MRRVKEVHELNLEVPRILTPKTPQQTRSLQSALLTYDDGTTELIEVEDQQGFHRISNYKDITIHEVFITHGEHHAQSTGSSTDS